MAARQPLFNFLPLVFSLLSFVLVLLILLAGTNNALSNLYYLKTDTSSLSIPSKLSSSTFLADLSAVSGADFTGSPATASSLGLAESYTLLLLTSCGHFPTGVVCDKPRVGFSFDPASHLKLDSTSLQGTFPPALTSALSSYHRTSDFLGTGYIISAALLALTPIAAFLSARHRLAGATAAVLSSLASVLLFASTVAAAVTFRNLNTQLNSALNPSGLRSETGIAPVALGFVAFVLALLASVILIIRARNPAASPRGRMVAHSIGTGYNSKSSFAPEADAGAGATKPGLWRRVPTWTSHRYVQVEKQPALLKTATGVGSMEGVVVTSPAGTRTRVVEGEDDLAAGDDEYSGHGGEAAQRGIPMLSLGNKRERDVGGAYEPYSGASRGGI